MMNRYSIPMNSKPDERIYFFYWEDMIAYLREEIEADGNTFRYNITNWKEKGAKGHKTQASCILQWIRINPETKMASLITRTATCEDNTILPTVDVKIGSHVRKEWAVAQW